MVLGAGIYVNRPSFETLYVGLERSDVTQISIALAEANIDFNVGADGGSIQVPVGMTGKARLLLAERGLPSSANAGYELFDNVGSLGLTSFMQEVTRVRALEGEIGRTIQQISGIAAARVHIVMPERGSFRKADQNPTASVMIRASATVGRNAAASIRHLVASSVPGLDVDDVTVLDSTGQLLASGDDPANSALNQSLGVVQNVQTELEKKIDNALAPFLGMDNFRTSVTARLNTDTQQIQETVFDPESRVERSTRVTKEEQKSSQQQPDNAATVQQNIPQAAPRGGAGPQSSDQAEKKEEQTNYEINSKTIATVKNSYTVERLSIAVVVNRGRLAAMVGEPVDQAKIDAYLQEMQKIVSSAAGIDANRGDVVTLNAMDFVETQLLDQAVLGSGYHGDADAQSWRHHQRARLRRRRLPGGLDGHAAAGSAARPWRKLPASSPRRIRRSRTARFLPGRQPVPVAPSWTASAPTSASTAPTICSAWAKTQAPSTVASRKDRKGALHAWSRSAKSAPQRSCANGLSRKPPDHTQKSSDSDKSRRIGGIFRCRRRCGCSALAVVSRANIVRVSAVAGHRPLKSTVRIVVPSPESRVRARDCNTLTRS